ncbi:MAG: nitrilase-related carbon-nitrogen hydrolase, partial [Nitrospiria bacterium]
MVELSPWLILIAAFLFTLVVGGKWNIPIAAWLAPAFLLHFLHSQSPGAGFTIAVGVVAVAFFFSWKGLAPLPFPAYIGFIVILAFFFILPFLSDRLLIPYFPGFLSTLVFPITLVLFEILTARLSPYGSWGSVAYTQYGNLSLMQVASVTGIYGITFLIGWFGSTLAWAWGSGFSPQTFPGIGIYMVFLAGTLLVGGKRLALNHHDTPTVRVALVTESDLPSNRSFMSAAQAFMGNKSLDDTTWGNIRQTSTEVLDSLFLLSEREAKAGAKIIIWAEAAGLVVAEEEATILRRATSFAREHQIFLALPVATVHREPPRFENKVAMVTPEGNIAWLYHKSRPVPGPESARTIRGDSTPRTIDTPYGRLGVLICFDADFPFLARPFEKAKIDILLVPASDWKDIDPIHSQMAVFRGVEIGASVLRPARAGLSIATDPYGRVIACQDYFSTSDRTLV